MGYKIDVNTNDVTPKTMQDILLELKDKNEFSILLDMLLRSMKKAIYSANNIGHFGLASKIYTHFTSPIRRYPDLQIHRIIKDHIRGRMKKERRPCSLPRRGSLRSRIFNKNKEAVRWRFVCLSVPPDRGKPI